MKKCMSLILIVSIIFSLFSISYSNSENSKIETLSSERMKNEKISRKAYKNLMEKFNLEKNKDNEIPYSGAYIDEEGNLNINLVNKKAKDIKNVKKIIKDMAKEEKIEFHDVEFTLKELYKVKRDIEKSFEKLDEKGFSITSVGLIEKENRIHVGLERLNDEAIEEISKITDTSAIKFVEEDMGRLDLSRSDEHNPLIGGIQVECDSSFVQSSLGFPAYHDNGTVGIVLAGHTVGNIGDTIYQADILDRDVAEVTKIVFEDNGICDASFAKKTSSSIDLKGEVYGGYKIGGVLYSNNTPEGMSVLKHGIETGTTQGEIISKDFTFRVDGKDFYHQIKASYTSSSGDSGGTVTDAIEGSDGEYVILGIHQGRSWGKGVYTPYEDIKSELNITRPLWWTDIE